MSSGGCVEGPRVMCDETGDDTADKIVFHFYQHQANIIIFWELIVSLMFRLG